MSYIATMQGEVEFPDQAALENAEEELERMSGDNGFQGIRVVDDSLTVTIEFGVYRGLGAHLDRIFQYAAGGYVIGYSNDSGWEGFVETTRGRDHTSLEEWAAENGFDNRPDKDDFETEDEWFDNYVDWQSEVELAFMDDRLSKLQD